MAAFSKELLNMLSEFMVCEVGSRILDGITYAMISKDKSDANAYARYMLIKNEAVKCGYSDDEVFRVYELCNGYIFDMDLGTAKQIALQLAKSLSKIESDKKLEYGKSSNSTKAGSKYDIKNAADELNEADSEQEMYDIINTKPEQRRRHDMVNLAKYIKFMHDSGKMQCEVALFNRNSTNKIILTGLGPNGENLVVKYNAYSIRHWDVEEINAKFLIPAGFRVRSIQPCEVLPSKMGVSFIFRLEDLNN